MNTVMIVALAVAIPVILFPAALIWYLNIGGVVQALKQAKREKETAPAVEKQ